jgi:polar amino acid transport system substrate-binding protein
MYKKLMIVLAISIIAQSPLHAEETLMLNSAFSSPLVTPNHQGTLDVLYRTLGQSLGYNIQIETIPAERALINVNKNIEDGDVCRIAHLEMRYPNLIQATEPTMDFQMSAFTKLNNVKLNGMKSLAPYHVGYLTGWKILEKEVTGVKQISLFTTDKDLFWALEKNQIDVAIIEKSQGVALLQAGSNIRISDPPLIEQPCYLYLHTKHAALLPKFSAEIKQMKKDGRYAKIFNKALLPYKTNRTD